jgi:hypothetical protein
VAAIDLHLHKRKLRRRKLDDGRCQLSIEGLTAKAANHDSDLVVGHVNCGGFCNA